MIRKISKMKDFGIYKDFVWKDLNLFEEKNIIYGWNYSGKTTLSRIFSSLRDKKLHMNYTKGSFSIAYSSGSETIEMVQSKIEDFPFDVRNKNVRLAKEVDEWTDETFLNKAKLTIRGQLTRATLLLLGKSESDHFLAPAVGRMTWILKDERHVERDYEHFGLPFILTISEIFAKIRNLKYRYIPDQSLFPIETNQYEPYVIREALHNCIAHQDYTLQGRINVVESPDELIFTNS